MPDSSPHSRLLAAGWRQVNVYGALRWEDPRTRAWMSESQAMEKMQAQQQRQKAGDMTFCVLEEDGEA